MTFELIDNTEATIVATGSVNAETPLAFQNFVLVQNIPPASTVVLNSGGGDLSGGIDLGRLIRGAGLNTRIGQFSGETEQAGRCLSACALAFLGGVAREVPPEGIYGVHQLRMDCQPRDDAFGTYPWLPQPGIKLCPEYQRGLSAVQQAQGEVTAYVAAMGVDARLLTEMASTLPDEINILSRQELVEFKIATAKAAD